MDIDYRENLREYISRNELPDWLTLGLYKFLATQLHIELDRIAELELQKVGAQKTERIDAHPEIDKARKFILSALLRSIQSLESYEMIQAIVYKYADEPLTYADHTGQYATPGDRTQDEILDASIVDKAELEFIQWLTSRHGMNSLPVFVLMRSFKANFWPRIV